MFGSGCCHRISLLDDRVLTAFLTLAESGRRASVIQTFTRAETSRRMSATLNMVDINGEGTDGEYLY